MCNVCARCRQSTKSNWFRFVTMEGARYLEIANVVFLGVNGQVGRFSHAIRTVKPFDQFAVLRDAKHGRTDRIHGHDVTLVVDGQTGHDIDVSVGEKEPKVSRSNTKLHQSSKFKWTTTAAHAQVTNLMTMRLINCPLRVKICIRDRSLPRSQTTILPDWRMTATLRGYHI